MKQQPIGGVQSWIETIKQALPHDVVTWGKGEPRPSGRFGVGILANWCDTGHLAGQCDRTVSVSHGIIEPERPGFADRILFTSEGVKAHWNGSGDIIRQPINLGFWQPADVERIYLTRFSYRYGLSFVHEIALKMGLKYRHVNDLPHKRSGEILQQSVCVLATGRAALEAMACGVPVVICDHRSSYQGALLDTDTQGAMARNYSGRGGIKPTAENVQQAINAAVEVGSLRAHVQANHDAEKIAQMLL